MDNSLSPIGAARAYQSAKKLQGAPAIKPLFVEESAKPSFAQVLENTVRDSVQTVRAGEAAALQGLQGTLPTQKVVEATMAMESALKVTVALRDRVVDAYQEVMRMSV